MAENRDSRSPRRARPCLIVTDTGGARAPAPGTRIPLDRDRITLGRSAPSEVRLLSPRISKRHCRLAATPGGVRLVDLGSTNGCRVNGRPAFDTPLEPGDRIEIGPFKLRFEGDRARAEAAPLIRAELAVGTPFSRMLVRELRRTPIWLISLIVHVAAILLIARSEFILVPDRTTEAERAVTRIVYIDSATLAALAAPERKVDPPDRPEPEPDPEDRPEPEAPPTAPPPTADPSDRNDRGAPDAVTGLAGRGPDGEGGVPTTVDTERLEGALEGTRLGARVADLRGSGLDVCIVFDSTASMGGVITQVKRRIGRMTTFIDALVGGNFRLAMVTYRDRLDVYQTREVDFTRDHYRVLDFVERVRAEGGSDLPEGVLDGIRAAVHRLTWRPDSVKVILLFGDAPPHAADQAGCEALARRFRGSGTLHTIFAPVGGKRRRLNKMDRRAIRALTSLADAGGGTFHFLEEEDLIVRELQALIFGAEFRDQLDEVSRLVDFGPEGRRIRREIRDGELDRLLRRLAVAPHPLVIDALIAARDPGIVREVRRIARDPAVPAPCRSAARYVLTRKGVR
jgi:pSer/pThr/pTyr-binding forkhead associated (FHA) protein